MSIKFEKKEMLFSQKNHYSNISFRFSLNALSNLRRPLALNVINTTQNILMV